jgi:DNA-binding MarR family transcriptional regulator
VSRTVPVRRLVTELLKTLPDLGRALHAKPDAVATRAVCDALPDGLLDQLRHGQPPTPAQIQLAIELAQDGPATVGELAHRLGVSAPAASLLVDRMTEHGMVERRRDTEDRRVVWVQLTPAAQAIANAMLGVWRERLTGFMETLPQSERESFVRNVARFARVLGPSPETAGSRSAEGAGNRSTEAAGSRTA